MFYKTIVHIRLCLALELAMQVVAKYDCEVFMFILFIVYKALVPFFFVIVDFATSNVFELSVFGYVAFITKTTLGLKVELLIFRRTIVLANPFNIFTWSTMFQTCDDPF
jgi:hypothetical protein